MDVQQREQVVRAYRGWAESYERLMGRTYHRVERMISRHHLSEHLRAGPGHRLLDAGGGDGHWCSWAIDAGFAGKAVLLDVSPDMLRLGAHRGDAITALCADIADIPLPDNSFDLAFALGGVLSHGDRAEQAVRELVRVVKPGGHLALSVDGLAVAVRTATESRSPALLDEVLTTGTAEIFHYQPFPFAVRFFRPAEIRDLVELAGAEILSIIGKPVFTRFASPRETLSSADVQRRVELEIPFLSDRRLLPFADQIEIVATVGGAA
jgi:ubiquinone/menaquinone biosynthesis C-methylase UbiE